MPVGIRPNGPSRALRALLQTLAAAAVATALAGCDPAHSDDSGNDNMIFGLFKGRKPSVVDPAVGAALVRGTAFPASTAKPPAPAYPAIRDMGGEAPPPGGRLVPTVSESQPIRAWVAPPTGGRPGVALVNFYDPDRLVQFWELDARDPTRFAKQRSATFAPDQAKWVAYDVESAITLPGDQVLLHLAADRPIPGDGLFVYDAAADRVRDLGLVSPDWSKGVPFQFFDTLQVAPDAVLVLYHTDRERLGPQRYVNRFDHLVLFSTRHREGLPVLTLSLDDGNVRQWGLVGRTLWLRTSDDRGRTPIEHVWSLDLPRVL